jgi:hypothetical protein
VIGRLPKQPPYEEIRRDKVKLPRRRIRPCKAVDYPFKYVPEKS